MPDPGYRWLLLPPFIRIGLLSLVMTAFCLSGLFLTPVTPAPGLTPEPDPVPVADNRMEWPRTVLRLWFLMPSLLPLPDR